MCGIGTVCEQYGLTPRAVRFYEDRGLIESGRDRLNCRRYDARARARLQRIADYRRAGLSLHDIAEILAAEELGEARQRECATHKLRARLAELEGSKRHAEVLLQQFERVVPLNADGAARRLAARSA